MPHEWFAYLYKRFHSLFYKLFLGSNGVADGKRELMPFWGTIKKHELALIVNAMNNVASWFGDPAVTPEEVDALCENVFLESKDGVVVNYGEVVHQIVEDPAFRTFLAGQGSVHYG